MEIQANQTGKQNDRLIDKHTKADKKIRERRQRCRVTALRYGAKKINEAREQRKAFGFRWQNNE